jgi:hypothetical protein
LLAPFSDAGVSMTGWNRARRGTRCGSTSSSSISKVTATTEPCAALAELARRAPYLKLLGSYPMAAY